MQKSVNNLRTCYALKVLAVFCLRWCFARFCLMGYHVVVHRRVYFLDQLLLTRLRVG